MNQTEYFKERKVVLEKEIAELERELSLMPEGSLVHYKQIKNNTVYHLWYKEIVDNGKKCRVYLSGKKEEERKLLAKKKYLSRILHDHINEIKCLNWFIEHREEERFSQMLAPTSPYRSLLTGNNTTLQDWEYAPYCKSNDHPEHLIVKAPKGDFVRSKSEAMIAQVLYTNGIPYRYENVHDINGVNIATDFTIMHPKTYEIKLWEHFGLCDKPSYQPTIDFKMHHYIRAGYLPGHNLILTFEDEAHPLSFMEIESTVRKLFL